MKQGRMVVLGGRTIFWYSADESGREEEIRIESNVIKREVCLAGERCASCGTLVLSGQADLDSTSLWND